MKISSYSLFLFIFLSSCYSHYINSEFSDLVIEKPRMTNVPIKPTGKKPTIIFKDEEIPDEPYIKVDLFEISGSENTYELLERLQLKGLIRGVDAIKILRNETVSEPSGEYIYSYDRITALGIKYIKNIDYLEACNKQANIISLNKKQNNYDTVAVILTNWKGDFLELKEGASFYWGFLYNYSLQHLVFDVDSNWKFKSKQTSSGAIKIKKVKYSENPYVEEKIIHLKKRGRFIQNAKIKDNSHRNFSGTVQFYYDPNDYLVSKEIFSEKYGNILQRYIYDKAGLLLRIDVFKIKNKKEEFYFKAVFERYQQEDLEELLKAER